MTVKEKQYNHDFVIERLKDWCGSFPTVGEAAKALDVSRTFLWKVLNKQAPPTVPILDKIGFRRERITTYAYFMKEKVNA